MRRPGSKTVIGRVERVDLPELGIAGLACKIDTGARTSALHVTCLEELPDGRIGFEIVLGRGPRERIRAVAEVTRRADVRASTGRRESRWFVATTIEIAGVRRAIELGLTCRRRMRYRMLLGRSALGDFLVDPGASYVLGRGAVGEAP